MRKAQRLLVALALIAALIAWVRPAELLQRLGDVQPTAVLLCAGMIALAGLVGAVNLWLLVRRDTHVAFRNFLPAYWTAWAVGMITPGQIGDLATISVAMHRRGIDWRLVLGRSLLDKVISAAMMAAFATAALWHGGVAYASAGRAGAMLLVLALAAAIITLVAIASATVRRYAAATARHGRDVLREFLGLARKHPRALVINAILTLAKLLLTGASYVWAFRAIGDARLGLLDATQNCAAAGLVAYLPISFNGIGTVEVAGVALFGSYGITAATVIAAYVLLRVLGLGIAGGGASLWLLAGRDRNAISQPSSPQK